MAFPQVPEESELGRAQEEPADAIAGGSVQPGDGACGRSLGEEVQEPVRLNLLGGVRVTAAGAVVDGFTSKKTLALLSYLALTGRPHSREALSGLLWGESSSEQARASLRTVLWDLRQHLPSCVRADRHTIFFNPDAACWVDIVALREGIEIVLDERDPAPAEGGERVQLVEAQVRGLEEAVPLYRGDFMAGFFVSDAPDFEDWMLRERERARDLVLRALHRLLMHYKETGAHGRAVEAASRMLTLAPWQEEVHRELMRLLALDGRRSEALAQYQTCRRMLDDELGVEPTIETRLLYRRIKAGRPLDEDRYVPALAALDPIAACRDASSRVSTLIGREDETAALKEMLSEPGAGLVTLVGAEGVGKTSLAISIAAQVAPGLDDGARYIPSRDCNWSPAGDDDDGGWGRESRWRPTPERQLPLRIAREFGLTLSAHPSESDLLDYLGRRDVLLVLDDYEASPVREGFLLDMLRHAPRVQLLVIAVAPLGVPSERVLQVGGLKVPPALGRASVGQEFCEELLAYDSVRLFVDGAAQVCPGFQLAPGNASYVGRICRSTRGLPLGIELVAACVGQRPIAEIADSIDYWLKRSTAGRGPGRPGPGVLEIVFFDVWDHLSSRERRALSRLVRFQSHFGQESAEEIAGVPSAVLRGLANKRLLRSDGSSRYHWHPALRRLALTAGRGPGSGREAPGEPVDEEAFEQRYRAHYLDTLATQGSDLRGSGAKAASVTIHCDWHHIRRAWEGAAAEADTELLDAALEGLIRFVLIQRWHREGAELIESGVRGLDRRAQAGDDGRLRTLTVRLLVGLAHLLNAQRLPEPACRMAEAALARVQAAGAGSALTGPAGGLEAAAHREWGRALRTQGELQAAQEHLEQALAVTAAGDISEIRASTLRWLGSVEMDREMLDRALGHLTEALGLYRQLDDHRGQAEALGELAVAAVARLDYEAAGTYAQEAVALAETLGDRALEGAARTNLGLVASAGDDYARARTHCERALGIARELADPVLEGEALLELAGVHLHEGKKEEAWRRSLLALELARGAGWPAMEARALLLTGHVFSELGMAVQAFEAYEDARSLQAGLGQSRQMAESIAGLARASLATGDSRAAVAYVEEILPRLEAGDLAGVREPMRVYLGCYQVLRAIQDPRALGVLTRASILFEDAFGDGSSSVLN